MSNWAGTGSSWQYARWVWNICRNSRITAPTTAEEAAIVTFLKAIWNPVTRTGTREWLDTAFKSKAVGAASDNYVCNLDTEPTHVLVELVGVVGRDFDNIPITDAEKALADTLITATGNRRYGTTPYYGNVGGSTVTVP